MEDVTLSYAKGLFLLARENDKALIINKQVNEIHELLETNDGFMKLMGAATISKIEKKDLITKMFAGKLEKDLYHFILLLIDKNRINMLHRIAHNYHKLYIKHYELKEAHVYSVFYLKQEQLDRIKEQLSIKYNSTFLIKNKIDKKLIGGVKIVIDDYIIDGSVKYQLKQIERSINK